MIDPFRTLIGIAVSPIATAGLDTIVGEEIVNYFCRSGIPRPEGGAGHRISFRQ
jgi:hypothetical protein